MWPTSPANPDVPRTIAPSLITPAPMPTVPVTYTDCPSPTVAPRRASARAAQFASFSTATGSPVAAAMSAATERPRHPRFGAIATTPLRRSTRPGTATVAPTTRALESTSSEAASRASATTTS